MIEIFTETTSLRIREIVAHNDLTIYFSGDTSFDITENTRLQLLNCLLWQTVFLNTRFIFC